MSWAIDLGTTNTGIACWDEVEGRPRMVELEALCRRPGTDDIMEAPRLVPSATEVIADLDLWSRLARRPFFRRRVSWGRLAHVGRVALERNETRARPGYVPSFKAYLTREPLRPMVRTGGRVYTARDVAGLFLRELLAETRRATGERVRELVVTTPVDAYEAYRAELAQLCRGLGVRQVRFIDEPVAAALGYGLGLEDERRVLVVDFGGGTLDLALVALTPRGMERGGCRVLAKAGRPIGGDLVDTWLAEDFCRRLDYRIPDDASDPMSVWRRLLRVEACRVKEAVFFRDRESFYLTPPEDLRGIEARLRGEAPILEVTRDDLVAVLRANGLYAALDECLDAVMAGAREEQIHDVLMVGGSTLLPGVYPLFERCFGRDRVRAWQPFEAVAFGACAFSRGHYGQSDFIVHDYAIVTYDPRDHRQQHTVIVPRGTRFPTPPDLWRRQLVPTCSLGEPETIFKLVICEIGRAGDGQRRFAWDASGNVRKLGGGQGAGQPAGSSALDGSASAGGVAPGGDTGGQGAEPLVVPLNQSNPALGHLRPPHSPGDRRPRLDIAFGVDAERWLCATVEDLRTRKTLMRNEPVVRLL